jgi:hypothetical protein
LESNLEDNRSHNTTLIKITLRIFRHLLLCLLC